MAIASIVEGRGEAKSLPSLLSMLLSRLEAHDIYPVDPILVHRQKVVKPGELEEAIAWAVRKRKNVGAILVLLDADDDCPAKLAPKLVERAKNSTHLPVKVVLAKREFEAWFLGCKESFRGFMGIAEDAVSEAVPEEEPDPKGLLKRNMRGTKYAASVHQADFVRKMNIDLCRESCPSFDKLIRDVQDLVGKAREV